MNWLDNKLILLDNFCGNDNLSCIINGIFMVLGMTYECGIGQYHEGGSDPIMVLNAELQPCETW